MQQLRSTLSRLTATSRLGAWALVVLWALIILVLMTQPGVDEIGGRRFRFGASSAGHAAFFMILAVLVGNALTRQPVRRWWWACVLTTIYGVATEVVQGTLVVGRTPSLADITADAFGAVVGATAWAALERMRDGDSVVEAMRSLGTRHPRQRERPPLPRVMHPEA